MADELFAEVKSEGATLDIDKAFDRLATKEDTTTSASQTEKKEADKPTSQKDDNDSDEKTPFHKHPRWIKNQEELKIARAEAAEAKAKAESLEKGSKVVEIPKWWVDAYGDSAESKQNYQNYETATQAERDRLRDEVKEALKNEATAEQTQVADGEAYVEEQFSEMSAEGLKFERNSLLKFMVDFQKEFGAGSLLDGEGNYDFRKALTMQNRMQPPAVEDNSTRKNLAGQAGHSKGSGQSASKIPVVSRRALRKGGWREAGEI